MFSKDLLSIYPVSESWDTDHSTQFLVGEDWGHHIHKKPGSLDEGQLVGACGQERFPRELMPTLSLQVGGVHHGEQVKQRKKSEGAWHAGGTGSNYKWLECRVEGDRTARQRAVGHELLSVPCLGGCVLL